MHAIVEPTLEILEDEELFEALDRQDRGRRIRFDEPSHRVDDLPSRPHFGVSPTNARPALPAELVAREQAVDEALTQRYRRHALLATLPAMTPSLVLVGLFVIGTAMLLWWFSRALAF